MPHSDNLWKTEVTLNTCITSVCENLVEEVRDGERHSHRQVQECSLLSTFVCLTFPSIICNAVFFFCTRLFWSVIGTQYFIHGQTKPCTACTYASLLPITWGQLMASTTPRAAFTRTHWRRERCSGGHGCTCKESKNGVTWSTWKTMELIPLIIIPSHEFPSEGEAPWGSFYTWLGWGWAPNHRW